MTHHQSGGSNKQAPVEFIYSLFSHVYSTLVADYDQLLKLSTFVQSAQQLLLNPSGIVSDTLCQRLGTTTGDTN
jgi:hypothetical protein